jgi:hypothetical protein
MCANTHHKPHQSNTLLTGLHACDGRSQCLLDQHYSHDTDVLRERKLSSAKYSETYLPFQTPSPYPLNLETAPLPKLRVCRFPGRTAKPDAERL